MVHRYYYYGFSDTHFVGFPLADTHDVLYYYSKYFTDSPTFDDPENCGSDAERCADACDALSTID
jgi:hypothetical protein